ncbi:co-chaperone protein [Candidatus Photodesmus katoptron]|uniref:Co-chaperone protein HscB homolog n=1 Tax=Candidatus Photodesmus katoptron Akat1 TaxID=1236703 RepID=S3DG18_9GAMM|nr:Fe-S protein assembly co-chaperone HscB [Candidatus Photodesmus katoptron]EPE37337.1 fe-S protein assembly co-chaperone HscB [Candidatus Photodesmus katoptron Akat1]KEY89992.1 co-chaperone protein [Candidatus Photodesmus katoptron]
MNYFELFGLPVQFGLDKVSLSIKFRKLQRCFHPDNFIIASEEKRSAAFKKTLQLNDAYRVLKSPISRAEYLLAEKGIQISRQKPFKDTEFLVKHIELHDELDQLSFGTNPKSALADFDGKISNLYEHHLVLLEQEFQDNMWIKAERRVNQLKFLDKLKNRIEQIEDQLFN